MSVLDGRWIEGCVEGKTGWSIGGTCVADQHSGDRTKCAAETLCNDLEKTVLARFLHDREQFMDRMSQCIVLDGSFFDTHRMVGQYVMKACFE